MLPIEATMLSEKAALPKRIGREGYASIFEKKRKYTAYLPMIWNTTKEAE